MKPIFYYWIFAILITLSAAYYQRKTGPTYPVKDEIRINNKLIKYYLPRSCNSDENAKIEISYYSDLNISLKYKRLKTNDEWTNVSFTKVEDKLIAELPKQAPAGKLIYELQINNHLITKKSVIIRFKGSVPSYILIPHILFMFIAMLFSNLSGILAIRKNKKYLKIGIIAFLTLTIGGMILGPIVQKFAFGEFWTGIPFGWDLTDNKTLIAFLSWIVAISLNLKKRKPIYIFIAALILLLMYSIPHSMFGSELNYTTGQVGTGK